ncbi:hypothetical protein [Phaeobacter inhibens]|uniref:hypothetical protein n=1 Tax=Phaeobacter inhibens TaxID=221822 RepID=UPI000C9D03B0|nr:hypothetical protein [Phaeobacter inhibens]
MPSVLTNITAIAACLGLSVFSAIVGYHEPVAINAVAPTAITAISIIFGLSLSTLAITAAFSPVSDSATNDKRAQTQLEQDVFREDLRTIKRHKYLILLFLAAVFAGISFITIFQLCTGTIWASVASAVFSFLSALSLCLAFYLPFVIASQLERDSDLRRT